MRKVKSIATWLTVAISLIVALGWNSLKLEEGMSLEQNTIVLLQFKAQPDKGDHAVAELIKLIEKVKNEPHFVSIKLHVDPNDEANILLYEEWKDASYFIGEHMKTSYMKDFQANSINFLMGPPEITFWEVKEVFK